MRSLGAESAALARRQRGRISRAQLVEGGLSAGQITRAVASGALIPRRRGVYAVGWVDSAPLGALWEAHLAGGPDSTVSHWSAAFVHGLVAELVTPVELTVPRRRRTPGLRLHERPVPPTERIRVDHLPTTCTARTLLDVSLTATDRQLERMLDQAAYLDRDLSDLDELIARGRPGAKRLRAVRRRHTPGSTRTASANEERLLALIRAAGLPDPICNARVEGHLVDFWWPEARLVVELDDRSHLLEARFHSDRRRDLDLALAGIRVVRITTARLAHEPQAVIGELARLLSSQIAG